MYASNLLKQPKVANLFPNPANVTYDEFRNKVLALNFYFPSLRYTRISQVPQVNIVALASNIGGTLGLFLVIHTFVIGIIFNICAQLYHFKKGMSALSIFEFVEIFIDMIIIAFKNFIWLGTKKKSKNVRKIHAEW